MDVSLEEIKKGQEINDNMSPGEKNKIELGSFTERTLRPQLHQFAAKLMAAYPYNFTVVKKKNVSKEDYEKITKAMDLIFFGFTETASMLEQDLSKDGNSVVIFDRVDDEQFNFYVPNIAITNVDPATKQLRYAQTIRYLSGGNFINIVVENRSKDETTFSFGQFLKGEDGPDVKQDKEHSMDNLKKYSTDDIDSIVKDLNMSSGGFSKDDFNRKVNIHSFITGEYFQNHNTKDMRGIPDILPGLDLYGRMLNELYIRIGWELKFNKSKVITTEEQGTNPAASMFSRPEAYNLTNDEFAVRRNNMRFPMSASDSGYEFWNANNSNLQFLLQLFNYYLKKWWERAFHHMSGSDSSTQHTDLQMEEEKIFHNVNYAYKVTNRKVSYKRLVWKVLQSLEGEDLRRILDDNKYTVNDIEIEIKPFKAQLVKQEIENEIMKIQANLSSRADAKSWIEKSLSGTEAKQATDEIFDIKIEELKRFRDIVDPEEPNLDKFEEPVGVQQPSINNPQSNINNQSMKSKMGVSGK